MNATQHRILLLCILTLLASLGFSACTDVSPAFGQYYQGRSLTVSVVNIDRVPELRYSTRVEQQDPRHMRITPSEGGLELVVVHLKIENHTATSAILNVNKQGAELRDITSEKYFPLDINVRVKEIKDPPKRGGRSERILELQDDGTFPTSKGFINGPFELAKGMGINGWMIFEAPKGTKFREFKWRAGDSLTITF